MENPGQRRKVTKKEFVSIFMPGGGRRDPSGGERG